MPADLLATSQKIIDCFYRCCYGGWQIPHAEIEVLRREVERTATL
jgi:hypothetical protein